MELCDHLIGHCPGCGKIIKVLVDAFTFNPRRIWPQEFKEGEELPIKMENGIWFCHNGSGPYCECNHPFKYIRAVVKDKRFIRFEYVPAPSVRIVTHVSRLAGKKSSD